MKKLIIWLAKKFNVNIQTEKIVFKEIIKTEYITSGIIEGDVIIKGNLFVDGDLQVSGSITFNKKL